MHLSDDPVNRNGWLRLSPKHVSSSRRPRRSLAGFVTVLTLLLTGLVAVIAAPSTAQGAANVTMMPVVAHNPNNDATSAFSTIVIKGDGLPVAPASILGDYTNSFAEVKAHGTVIGGVNGGVCKIVIGASTSTELVIAAGGLGGACINLNPFGTAWKIFAGDTVEVTLTDPVTGPFSVTGTAIAPLPTQTPEVQAVTPPYGPMTGGNEVVVTTPVGSVTPQAFWFGGYTLTAGWYGTASTNISPVAGEPNKFKVIAPAFISGGTLQNYGASVFSADSVMGISSQNCDIFIGGECKNEYFYVDSTTYSEQGLDVSGLSFAASHEFPVGDAGPACGLSATGTGATITVGAALSGTADVDANIGLSYSNAGVPQAVVGNGTLTVTEPITVSLTLSGAVSGCLEVPIFTLPGVGGLYFVVGAELQANVTVEVEVAKGTYSFTGGWLPKVGVREDTGAFGSSDVACVDANAVPKNDEDCITTSVAAGISGTVTVSPLWLQVGFEIPGASASVGIGVTAAAFFEANISTDPWPPVLETGWDVCAALRWAGEVSIDIGLVQFSATLGAPLIGPINIIGDGQLCPLGEASEPPPPPVSAAKSTVVANPTEVAADGTTASTVTVTVIDTQDNPAVGRTVTLAPDAGSSAVSAASGPSDANGVVTFTVTDTVGEAVTYTATADGVAIAQTAQVTFVPPPPVSGIKSTVVASPPNVAADGTTASTITVTLIDTEDNPKEGKTVTLTPDAGSSVISAASGPSDANGVVTFTVTDAVEETVTYSATGDGIAITQTAQVTFANEPPVSAAKSTVSASPTEVEADGVASSVVTVTLINTEDDPVAGKTVTLTPDAGSSVIGAASGPSDANGVVTFTVADAIEETVTYSATGDGIAITQTAQVTFANEPPVSAAKSTVSASPTEVAADGVAASTITVTLINSDDDPVAGKTVTLAPNAGTSSLIGAASGPSDAAGVVTFAVTNTTEETVTYSATDTTDGIPITATADVTFADEPEQVFASLDPARILETRPGQRTVDGLFAGIGLRDARTVTEVQVAGRGGVADDASSVVLNITVVGPEARGFITVFPCDGAPPKASNVNYEAGQTIANVVVAKLGIDGTVCIYNESATHVLADVKDGYFPAGSSYGPTAPARFLDSRPGRTTADAVSAGVGLRSNGTTTELQVTGRVDVPNDASAVALNITVVNPIGRGFITVFPCGGSLPKASNVNYEVGETIANVVVAKVGVGGKVCIYNETATHIIADVNGAFSAVSAYGSLIPARLLDSRPGRTTIDSESAGIGQRANDSVTELQVAGRADVPANATAVTLNLTVVGPLGQGFITVFPCGSPQPNASNLNYVAGQTIANTVVAKVGDDGKVCVFTKTATNMIADINGYFPG